jgi:hypothetical protein
VVDFIDDTCVDFNLKLLTLIYEEGRHWQSSEPLTPQVGTSAAGGPALATPRFSEGVLGAEEPAVGAPSGKLGVRARHLLHPSLRYRALRVAQDDFLALILAPTLRILDPSAKLPGQMYP